MKNIKIIILLLLLTSCTQNSPQKNLPLFPKLNGNYMEQEEPDFSPKLFAPDIISTGMSELNACFSPDYKEFFYSIRLPNRQIVIMHMLNNGKEWSKPEVAGFSGKYGDADPFISADGKWLYFVSNRPTTINGKEKKDYDIWRIEKRNGIWGEPENLDINSPEDDVYPSLTLTGKLYFSSGRKGSIGGRDIYNAEPKDNGFDEPERIEGNVNSNWEGDVFVSPQEDYLIFVSNGPFPRRGLHISFKDNEGWSNPKKMDADINVTGGEFCPIVSPDGRFFFYTSSQIKEESKNKKKLSFQSIKQNFKESHLKPQMGKSDIYWVSSKIFEKYKSEK